jgi:hypothetical protein
MRCAILVLTLFQTELIELFSPQFHFPLLPLVSALPGGELRVSGG